MSDNANADRRAARLARLAENADWDKRLADDEALLEYARLKVQHGEEEGGPFAPYVVRLVIARLLELAVRRPASRPPEVSAEVGRAVCLLEWFGMPQKAARAAIAKKHGLSAAKVRYAHNNELYRRKPKPKQKPKPKLRKGGV